MMYVYIFVFILKMFIVLFEIKVFKNVMWFIIIFKIYLGIILFYSFVREKFLSF